MRTFVLSAVILTSATLVAQQQPVTFRSGVTLVGVDVTVLDKDGRPVAGLTAEDFQITLNGKLQPVRTLSYVEVAEPIDIEPATSAPADHISGRAVVTNAVPVEDPKIFVLAIDDLSLPPEGGRRTLTAARRFVDSQPSNVLVGVTTTSGSVAVNPTLDRSIVTAALSHVVGSFIDPRKPRSIEAPTIGIAEALEIAGYNNTSVYDGAVKRECADGGRALDTEEYGQYSNAMGNYNSKCATDLASSARLIMSLVQGAASQQISALSNVLDAMRGAPGLKQMIVLTQGVAGTRNLISLFEPVTTAAAAAGVQLSFLMEDEDEVDMSQQNRGATALGQKVGGGGITERRREDRRMFVAALQTLADSSGGTFERVITNPDGALRRAALSGSAVYRLGVEVPPDASTSKRLDVVAAVAREGVTLRVNRHNVVPGAVADESPAEKVTAALRKGKPYYGVPMRVGVVKRRANNHQVELGVGLGVPGSVAGPLKVTVGVLDPSGSLKQGTQTIQAPEGGTGYRLTVPLPVPEGTYRVRLAVEDADGSVGSVDTEVSARLNPMGPVNASDLLTWWKDASGRPQFVGLDDMPVGVANLSAGVELYRIADVAVPADLSVRLSILEAGAATPVAEVDITPHAEGDVLRAEARLPLGSLASGSYVLRATVSSGGQRLGEVSTTINKK